MAFLTIRQKQQVIGYFALVAVFGGFLGNILQGNPVAITILVVLLLIAGLVIFVKVSKARKATAATQRAVQLHIPIMSDDTVDSLTVRILEHYSAQGAKITVTAAKAKASEALARHRL